MNNDKTDNEIKIGNGQEPPEINKKIIDINSSQDLEISEPLLRKKTTSVPSYIPKNWKDQIVLYESGGTKKLYAYFPQSGWSEIITAGGTDQRVTIWVADSNGGIMPTITNGAVLGRAEYQAGVLDLKYLEFANGGNFGEFTLKIPYWYNNKGFKFRVYWSHTIGTGSDVRWDLSDYRIYGDGTTLTAKSSDGSGGYVIDNITDVNVMLVSGWSAVSTPTAFTGGDFVHFLVTRTNYSTAPDGARLYAVELDFSGS